MVAILDIPESPAELGRWLDHVLMSLDLAAVVDELSVVHSVDEESIGVEQARQWLGDSFSAVMQKGLSVLEHARLRQLLLRPSLLPAIQELALVSGGPYWNHLAQNSTRVLPAAASSNCGGGVPRHRGVNRWLFVVVPLAVAASITAFVVIDFERNQDGVERRRPSGGTLLRGTGGNADVSIGGSDKPWGWNRTDVLDDIDSPSRIPNRLADALSEWFGIADAAGSDIQAVTLRVNEMWAGCEQLSTQPLDGVSADFQQRIRDVISAFQREVEAGLKELDNLPSSGEDGTAVLAVKRSIDAKVTATVESLRSLR